MTDIEGVLVGHAHDEGARTGCTVVLTPDGAVVGVDVRGSAPATRETDLCRPGTLVERANGIFLGGGSAFGLDAAGGVMRFLRERGAGFPTAAGPVPIVPGACIFDLSVGRPEWPDADMAYRACLVASSAPALCGLVGAGIGATVGKLFGAERAAPGGVGAASVQAGDYLVGALMVVNAVGDVVDPGTGNLVSAGRKPGERSHVHVTPCSGGAVFPGENTTIGVVATDAPLSSAAANALASVAHDGIALAIRPAHTIADGDALFVLATGTGGAGDVDLMRLQIAAVSAVSRAILRAVDG